jgi:hypothetical protein
MCIKITSMKFVWRLFAEEQGEQKTNWINFLAFVFSMLYDFHVSTVQSKNNVKYETKTEKKSQNVVV